MKITIDAEPKEIAAFVLAVQERKDIKAKIGDKEIASAIERGVRQRGFSIYPSGDRFGI